jgi:hypothetical protein
VYEDLGVNSKYHVAELNLESRRLRGPLPPELFTNLPYLVDLNLPTNRINGTLPAEIGCLSSLVHLGLKVNTITGSIPKTIANLTNLVHLSIDWNNLSGTIPPDIWTNLTKLNVILLSQNALTGTIPDVFWPQVELREAYFSFNHLEGSLPRSLGNPKIYYLDFDSNYLTGTIPDEYENLILMGFLGMHNNLLTGTLPAYFNDLRYLRYLYLHNNQITGTLPRNMTGMRTLDYFEVGTNFFSGTIPNSLGQLTQLRYFYVNNNYLSGSLPRSMSNIVALKALLVHYNFLGGSIENVFNASKQGRLETIEVSSNQLTGTLPDELFSLPRLDTLIAVSNCFRGSLPDSICHLHDSIRTIALDGMRSASSCSPVILPGISNAYFLSGAFGGTIPACLFQFPHLTVLHLSGNGLTGNLPTENADFKIGKHLVDLSLSHNLLEGSIPSYIQNQRWYNLDLGYNRFSGELLSTFYATNRNYTFSFSKEDLQLNITRSRSSEALNLEVNRLSGVLPGALKSIVNISVLDGNLFSCMLDKRDLPHHDPYERVYACGSSVFDVPFYGWIGVVGLGGLFLAALYVWRERLDAVFDVSERIRLLNLWLTIIQPQSDLPSELNLKLSNIQYVTRAMDTICYVALTSGAYLLVVLLPTDAALSVKYGTHTHQYTYATSASFQSGVAPFIAQVLLLIALMVVVIGTFRWNVLRLIGSENLSGQFGYEEGDEEGVDTEREEREAQLRKRQLEKIQKSRSHSGSGSGLGSGSCSGSESGGGGSVHGGGGGGVDISSSVGYFGSRSRSDSGGMGLSGVLPFANRRPSKDVGGENRASVVSFKNSISSTGIDVEDMQRKTSEGFYVDENGVITRTVRASAFGVTSSDAGSEREDSLMSLSSAPRKRSTIIVTSRKATKIERALVCIAFFALSVSVVLGANIAFVYVALYQSSVLFIIAQIALSFFKVIWNLVFAPILIQYTMDFLYADASQERKVSRTGFYSLELFVALFNNIAIPCLVVGFIEPDCFYNMLVAPKPDQTSFLYAQCTDYVIVGCVNLAPTIATITYDPPFQYSFQCSNAFITYYASTFVLVCFVSTFVSPISQVIALRWYNRLPKTSLLYRMLDLGLPRSLKPVEVVECGAQTPSHSAAAAAAAAMEAGGGTVGSNVAVTAAAAGGGGDHIVRAASTSLGASYSSSSSSPAGPNTAVHHPTPSPSPSPFAGTSSSSRAVVTPVQRNPFNPIFDANAAVCSLMTYLGILMTFGAIFPPLGVAVAVMLVVEALFVKCRLGRYIHQVLETKQYAYLGVIEHECHGVGSVRKLRESVWTLYAFSCIFYTLFLFDTLGGSVGGQRSVWVLFVVPLSAAFIYLLRLPITEFLRQRTDRERAKLKAERGDNNNNASSSIGGGGREQMARTWSQEIELRPTFSAIQTGGGIPVEATCSDRNVITSNTTHVDADADVVQGDEVHGRGESNGNISIVVNPLLSGEKQ